MNAWLSLLEELRYIAQQGLHYQSGDAFDQARYQRLLALSAQHYAALAQLPPEVVLSRFQAELGHITPKVGVNAAVFNPQGQLLLVQRQDDHCWGLPAGWCDVNESPEQALTREIHEELGLDVEVGSLLKAFTRLPGDFGSPHTSYHLLYLCQLRSSEQVPVYQPEEVLRAGWFDPEAELNWHRDHQQFARYAATHRQAQHV